MKQGIDNLTVSFKSFEEIEKENREILKNIEEANKAFGTKEYLDKELSWDRNSNSHYNKEGQILVKGSQNTYLGKGSLW